MGFEPYGGCLYLSSTGLYAFATNRNSPFDFDQYKLTVGASVTGSKVRDLTTSSLSESCVAMTRPRTSSCRRRLRASTATGPSRPAARLAPR